MDTTNDIIYWIALNHITEFGSRRMLKLRTHFPTMEEAWHASANELFHARIEKKIIESFLEKRKKITPDALFEKIHKQGIQIVTINEESYPSLLKEIPDAPAVLYYKGTLTDTRDHHAIAIVGARKITQYGKRATDEISTELSKRSISIVSGFALGTDTHAHNACIKVGGRTIAVMGNGIDIIYPYSNTHLADYVLQNNGLIFSEFPPGTPSYRSNFPIRNRIIAGLTQGTIVIEAAQKSGSLITAKCALEYNREVMAVPGSIHSPLSYGPNQLIRQGATPITSADDVMELFNIEKQSSQQRTIHVPSDTPEEAKIRTLLTGSPMHINDIIKQTPLDVKQINSILVIMELNGKVYNNGNMVYSLI